MSFQLISSNGKVINTSPYQPKKSLTSFHHCLNLIKTELKLDAEIPKVPVPSSLYDVLTTSLQKQNFIKVQGHYYLPLLKGEYNGSWSFIRINSRCSDFSLEKLYKAQSLLETHCSKSEIEEDCYNKRPHFCTLLSNVSVEESYQFTLKHYNAQSFSSFINLSEWLKTNPPLSLQNLCEFKNTLFYIAEVNDLPKQQIETLALYAKLPCTLRRSSIMACTKHRSLSNLTLTKEFTEKIIT